jgi:flagellar protein FliS
MELVTSLNGQVEGDLSKRLALLYDYIIRKLEEAHREQALGPLDEAEILLKNLHEGWKQLAASDKPEASRGEAGANQLA